MLDKTTQVGHILAAHQRNELRRGCRLQVPSTSAYLYDVDKINYHTMGSRKGWSALTPEREPLRGNCYFLIYHVQVPSGILTAFYFTE